MAYTQNFGSPNPMVLRPQIDATDRRQMEAVNEEKYNSSKETLDDIRCVHLKEKKKKEQKDAEKYQAGAISEGSVSTDL